MVAMHAMAIINLFDFNTYEKNINKKYYYIGPEEKISPIRPTTLVEISDLSSRFSSWSYLYDGW